MKRVKRVIVFGSLVGVWMLGPGANRAEAYIDPGTTSSLLPQLGIVFAVLSAFAAVAFQHCKRFCVWGFYAVLGVFGKSRPVKEPAAQAASHSQ